MMPGASGRWRVILPPGVLETGAMVTRAAVRRMLATAGVVATVPSALARPQPAGWTQEWPPEAEWLPGSTPARDLKSATVKPRARGCSAALAEFRSGRHRGASRR